MIKKISSCYKVAGRKKASYFTIISAAVFFMIGILNSCTKNDDDALDPLEADFTSIFPSNFEDSVIVDPIVSVTFKEGTDPKVISSAEISLKAGNEITPGTVSVVGATAQFIAAGDLKPESEYTAIVTTKQSSGTENRKEYSWKFKTGRHHSYNLLKVVSVSPLNNATAVGIDTSLTITFNKDLTTSMKNVTSVTLKNGTGSVGGTVSFSGKIAIFKPNAPLVPMTKYSGVVQIGSGDIDDDDDDDDSNDYKFSWSFTTAAGASDVTAPTVSSASPANNATTIPVGVSPTVTFSETMNPGTLNSTTFTLKQGTSTVAGSVSVTGATATFTPTTALGANKVYTVTVTTSAKDAAGNALASNYTWSFTTAAAADVTAPVVSSVIPANNATAIAVNSKATVTFSEAMDASTLTVSTFTLKQGSTSVPGVVTYTGTTATFTPSAVLAGNAAYIGTITTGAKDVSGNAIAANYTWTFTTAAASDVTAPTVSAVAPANNATSVPVNSKATATFSESMSAATITSTTFTLKQGSTNVAGSVTYSGTTATFTPSAALAGNTVYTATITTGAKDAAGNSLAANFTWSFTTAAVVTGKSFATDVMPILAICNNCHNHNWTPSSNASTFYTNLVNSGHVNPTTPTSGRIYTKLNGGHPGSGITAEQKNTILTWVTEGSNNN